MIEDGKIKEQGTFSDVSDKIIFMKGYQEEIYDKKVNLRYRGIYITAVEETAKMEKTLEEEKHDPTFTKENI